MIIALAQLNFTVGDFEGNARRIIDIIERAKKDKADLVIFSELSVCGYPPLDLLEYRYFVDRCEETVRTIALSCEGIMVIVGSPALNPYPVGKNLYNAAYILQDRAVKGIVYKTLLPTYDIFDEYRHFERNRNFTLWDLKRHQVAITICEDLWYKQPVTDGFGKDRLYTVNPVDELMRLRPDFIINIAASPYSYLQHAIRENILAETARSCQLPLVYVNQTGANTELIFDGGSLVINSSGAVIHRLKLFEEDYRCIDTGAMFSDTTPESIPLLEDSIASMHNALIMGIRDYFGKMRFSNAILGLSGGIDSAVTLVLASRALGNENLRVLLMSSQYSSDHSVRDAIDLALNLGVQYDILPISGIFNQFQESLQPLFVDTTPGIAEENIQARIRGNLLMSLSNKFGSILLNTSNKSEAAVGYGTLYGDMSGGLSVLGDVYKTQVYQLAAYINRDQEIIPKNTILKPPSAELKPDQKDTDSLPEYEVLDKILMAYIEYKKSAAEIVDMGLEESMVKRVIHMVNTSEYKRYQTPPVLRISGKAFGMGRRMPLVAKY